MPHQRAGVFVCFTQDVRQVGLEVPHEGAVGVKVSRRDQVHATPLISTDKLPLGCTLDNLGEFPTPARALMAMLAMMPQVGGGSTVENLDALFKAEDSTQHEGRD